MAHELKQAAVEQWSADPCDAHSVDVPIGSPGYFSALRAARADHAPWMADELGYVSSAGLSVLDVGCGQGIDAVQFALAGARVTAIDLTPRHLELARAHAASASVEVEIVAGDAEQLPFPNASFDRVVSNGVLHHTPDFSAAVSEAARVLVPGGEFRLIVYNRNSLHYWMNQLLLAGILNGGVLREGSMAGVLSQNVEHSTVGARPLVRVYGRRQLTTLLGRAGFVHVKIVMRQFHLQDAFLVSLASRLLPALRRSSVQDFIGRRAGWYLVAHAYRPLAGA